jgi:hypothetical protein
LEKADTGGKGDFGGVACENGTARTAHFDPAKKVQNSSQGIAELGL